MSIGGEILESMLSEVISIIKDVALGEDIYTNQEYADQGLGYDDIDEYADKFNFEDNPELFVTQLLMSVNQVSGIIQSFFNGDIDGVQCFQQLSLHVWNNVKPVVFNDGSLDLKNIDVVELKKITKKTLAYMAMVAVYEITSHEINECKLAHENRLRIEQECEEAVNLIIQYREEMNKSVEKYMSGHYGTFISAFEAIDKYIYENDTDGCISQNIRLQEYLGKKIQFRNQEEFDDLMDSDEAFKL